MEEAIVIANDVCGLLRNFGLKVEADRGCLGIDGDLPVGHPQRRLTWLAASRKTGPTPDLSRLLRIVGFDGVEIVLGRRLRLSCLSVIQWLDDRATGN